jgi:autotransporter-associated beta strand protein
LRQAARVPGAVVLVVAAIVAFVPQAFAQQYFNGAQTTPNGAINGGSGVWDNSTANWANATGTVSNVYDPTPSTVTVFGASVSSTPGTGGTVTVSAGGIQLTSTVQFSGTGDNSPYTIQGGPQTLATGGTTFNVTTGNFFTPSGVILSNIVGNGGAAVTGSGIITFGSTNTYAGGTLVSGDPASGVVLRVTNNNAVGAGSVTLQNGIFQAGAANLTFANNFVLNSSALGGAFDANSKKLTIAGTISGAGMLTIFNTSGGPNGNVVLTGANTYTGDTFICSCGTLTLGDPTHTASILGNVTNDGSFRLINANTSGITSITTEFGATTNFFNSTSAGTATITTVNGGLTQFFGNSTGGNAHFTTDATSLVDFSGSTGPNGDGRITAGSIAGAGTYIIGAGNTLIVGGNNLSTVVSGSIVDSCGCGPGSGSLVKVGSGTLTLSGSNFYTGTTTVNGGFLDVEGFIISPTTVNAGGALTGAGFVADVTIASGGVFLPGNGFGTSTAVNGDLTFQPGALYLVQLTSTTSTSAAVSGTANLAGQVGVSFAPGSFVSKQQTYNILTAGSTAGTFDGVTAPGGLLGMLSYDPNDVFLNFDLNWGAKYNLNVNQQNVANTLTNFFNANGGIPALFASLSPSALTQVSGELATGVQSATYNAMNLFISSLTDPFIGGRSGDPGAGGAQGYSEDESASAYAARQSATARDAFAKIPTKAEVARNDLLDNRWSVWGTAFGGGANISGDAALGSNSADVRAFGLAAGVDYRVSPQTIAGFSLAGGGTNFSVAGFGSGRSDLFQAGAFVRHTVGAAYVTGALAYGGQQVTTDRIVTVAGFDHLQARFNANAVSGRVEGGYRFLTPWMGVTPYAAGQFTTVILPAYAEQAIAGTGNFALNYAAQTATDARSELGVRTDRSYATRDGVLTLRGRLAWAHDFLTNRNVGAVFQSLPGAFFVVNGAAQAHDSALTTASAEMHWMNRWSAAATFEGEFSPVMNSYAGKGVVRYTW